MASSPSRAEESVKVVVRIRPLSKKEQEEGRRVVAHADEALGQVIVQQPPSSSSITRADSKDEQQDGTTTSTTSSSTSKAFTFDAVFGPSASQRQVYDACAAGVVEAVLDGYNGTIFAYGQTGGGKTHTIEGAGGMEDDPEERGIIPRSIHHIFARVAAADHAGQQFLVRASYLEIYNEEIRDLLAKDPKNKLELKEAPEKGVYVKDLTSQVVKSAEETRRVLQRGKRNRATGATLMNQASSRSHAIFTIVVECASSSSSSSASEGGGGGGGGGEEKHLQGQSQGQSQGQGQHIRVGKLNLVDLAGSERQSKTGATGERFKEATKINLSLSALGNVISALVDAKAHHVPYRDSKLTRLLMDSLGGNTKTVMCANCGPADYNYDETVSTLRYANRAKNIKNKPRVNEDPKETLLREFQAEIERLRAQLQQQQQMQGAVPPPPLLAEPKGAAREERVVCVEKLVGLSEAEARALEAKAAREARREADAALAAQSKEAAAREQQLRGRLSKEAEERAALEARLEELQAKVIRGGDEQQQQQGQGQQGGGGGWEEAMARRRLAQDLAIQEEATLALEGQYSSLQEEVEAKTRKLRRLWAKCQAQQREAREQAAEAAREREEMLETIRQLTRQLKLKNLVLGHFVPADDAARIEARAAWSEELDGWTLPRLELAGNNHHQPNHNHAPLLLLKPGARLAHPVATAGSKRPETHYARARRPYDTDPRFRAENVLELDLEPAPEGTTQHYAGAGTASNVARVLDVALDAEGEEAVPSSPFLRYAAVLRAGEGGGEAGGGGGGLSLRGGGGGRMAGAVAKQERVYRQEEEEDENEEFPTARGLVR